MPTLQLSFLTWGALIGSLLAFSVVSNPAFSQISQLALYDLSSFQNPGKSWSVYANVGTSLSQDNKCTLRSGGGILVNQPTDKNKGQDLFTNFEHDDLDLELDYIMAKGSNSGIYLQGRYELQLADNWGTTDRSAASNGGVYERWDDNRPEGQKEYEGYAPRQNAGRAPGLWQHLKIAFQERLH